MAFKNMLFAARMVVEGFYAGRHKSPFKGSAPEFVDYREYYPGDEMRTIDWKVYGRTDRHYVKLFEKETDLSCSLFLDVSGSMGYGGRHSHQFMPEPGLSKLEYGSYLCGALAYLMLKQGDKVSLTMFDETIRAHIPHGGTFSHLYSILNALEAVHPGGTTSLSNALRKTFALLRRKGLLIIVSDMLDEPDDIFAALSHYTHRGFEVILFHVLHEFEVELPAVTNAQFVDAETKEQLTIAPAEIRESYAKLLDEFRDTMETHAKARGIDYNFVTTKTPYNAILEKYLARRGRN